MSFGPNYTININFPQGINIYHLPASSDRDLAGVLKQTVDQLAAISKEQKRMADVLDQILANQGVELDDIGNVKAFIAKQQTEIDALKTGEIAVTDPRFQTALDNQSKILTAFAALVPAAVPTAPAESGPPAPPADNAATT